MAQPITADDPAAAATPNPPAEAAWLFDRVFHFRPDERIVLAHMTNSRVFTPEILSPAAALARIATVADLDCWVGVNPTSAVTGKGGIVHVTRLTALHADLDVKPGVLADKGEAYAAIAELERWLGIPPTAVVDSGGGLQPYWALDAPDIRTDADRDYMAGLLAAWQAAVQDAVDNVGGEKAVDAVFNLDRIMRVPGTMNRKPIYAEAPMARLVVANPMPPTPLEEIVRVLAENCYDVVPTAAKARRRGRGSAPRPTDPGDVVPTGAAWPVTDCAYATAAIAGWRTDLPERGRHSWHLHRATRLAAMAVAGCITQATHAATMGLIDDRLAEFRAGDDSGDLGETGRNHAKALERVDGSTVAELLADELGGHEHHAPPQGFTAEDLKQRFGIDTSTTAPPAADSPVVDAPATSTAAATPAPPAAVRPAPFTRASDPGPFPIDALPPVLRAHAEWLMEAANIPAALAGPMYLPILAAACGRATITPRPGWVEHGPLWVIVIAPPSLRKSPILAYVKAPIEAAQGVLIERVELERAAALAEVKILQELLEEREKAFGKARKAEITGAARPAVELAAVIGGTNEVPAIGAIGANTRALGAECRALREQVRAAQKAVPARAQLTFDDATDAAMQDLLLETGGYGFHLVPEASQWFIRVTTHGGFFSSEGYLKAYSGEPFSIFRVGRGEVLIDDPYICALHIIQPEPLTVALKPDANGRSPLFGNGQWARYGASRVDWVEADVFDRPITGGEAENAAYMALIEREFLRNYGRSDPLRFELTDEARGAFAPIYDRVERIKEAQQQLGSASMVEEWGKAAGRVLRIARVITQIELSDAAIADVNRVHEIGADAIARAWRITEWLMGSQAHMMGGAAAVGVDDLEAEAVTWVRETLRTKGPTPYRPTLRDNRRHRRYLDRALDRMATAGEIAITPGPRSKSVITPINLAPPTS